MLQYLAVWKAIVSMHRPIHSKITLTYSLTWQTDCCSPWRMAFKALLNPQVALSWALLKFSLRLLFKKTARTDSYLNTATCTIDYWSTSGHMTIHLHSTKSSLPFSLPFSLPLRHSCDELSQTLSRFSVLHASDGKLGGARERGYYRCMFESLSLCAYY